MDNGLRDYRFDNIKGLMIILVIIGHSITQLFSAGGGEAPLTKYLYYIIYTFHMPVFIFISGYFSRNAVRYDWRTYARKAVSGLLVPYIIFNVFYGLVYAAVSTHKYASAFNVLRPQWTLWFLLSLFFWRILVKPFSEKFRHPFLLSLLFSLCIGMAGFIGQTLSLSRTVAFFPYFLAGYFLSDEHLNRIRKEKLLSAAFLILAMIMVVTANDLNVSYKTFFMRASYANLGQSFPMGILFRASSLLTGLICIRFFLSFAPDKKCFLTDFGMYSLIIYLAHSVIIKLLDYSRLVNITDPACFVLFSLVFSLILCRLFGNGKIYFLYSTAINAVSTRLIRQKNEMH